MSMSMSMLFVGWPEFSLRRTLKSHLTLSTP